MVKWLSNLLHRKQEKVEIICKIEISGTLNINHAGQKNMQVQVSNEDRRLHDKQSGNRLLSSSADGGELPIQLRIDLPIPEAEFGQEVK